MPTLQGFDASLVAYNFANAAYTPMVVNKTGAAASTSQGVINLWGLGRGIVLECFNNIAATNAVPALSATAGQGLNIDNVTGAVSKIIEITTGNTANSMIFKPRTTAPFFVQASFLITTLADVTDLILGFRVQGTYQTTLTSYTDYAAISVHSTAGEVELQTQVASGGQTTTDTTQAVTAATAFIFRVNVDGSGNVTYLLNGVAPTTVAAYQFGTSLSVIPFLWYATPAGGHAEVDLITFECGLQ